MIQLNLMEVDVNSHRVDKPKRKALMNDPDIASYPVTILRLCCHVSDILAEVWKLFCELRNTLSKNLWFNEVYYERLEQTQCEHRTSLIKMFPSWFEVPSICTGDTLKHYGDLSKVNNILAETEQCLWSMFVH